jgi:hypothetical protein
MEFKFDVNARWHCIHSNIISYNKIGWILHLR